MHLVGLNIALLGLMMDAWATAARSVEFHTVENQVYNDSHLALVHLDSGSAIRSAIADKKN